METELETVQKEVLGATAPADTNKPEFKAAVGMSRLWDARAAGREVAEDTLKKLGGKKPDFFLLFSTIHYEKYGGFQELLNGVWEVLPEGTPLIGGTVAGFMNPEGCYTRGVTAMAAYYPNMDVAVGIGHNTKRNPSKAARDCANILNRSLAKSGYDKGYVFSLISGGLVPDFLGLGRKKVVSGITGKISELFLFFSLKFLQKGVGREEEVLDELVKRVGDCYVLEGSSMDDGRAMSNYQFIGSVISTNSIVALGIKTDIGIDITGFNKLNSVKTFSADKMSSDGRVIQRINGEPAIKGFLDLLQWPKSYLDDRLFRRTFFFPLGFKEDNEWVATVIGIVLGNSLVVLHKTKSREMAILSADGKSIINSIDDSLKPLQNRAIEFALISTCDAILEGLGSQNFIIYDKLNQRFNGTPFIALYCGGEGRYSPKERPKYGNLSFNTSVFYRQESSAPIKTLNQKRT